jgi:hypothetical protein
VSATLRVDASVETPYTAFPGKQTVHVYVTDQQKRAKKDAGVTIEVVYPDHSTRMDLQPTDKDGYTSYTFDLEPAPLGHIVVVRVSATSGADTGKTQTAFFYWR